METDFVRRYDLIHGVNGRGTFVYSQACLPFTAANPCRSGIPLLLRKMQGEFEKMQRGANRNRAKTGPFSMTCMGLSLLTEQRHNHCLAGTFRENECRIAHRYR